MGRVVGGEREDGVVGSARCGPGTDAETIRGGSRCGGKSDGHTVFVWRLEVEEDRRTCGKVSLRTGRGIIMMIMTCVVRR